MRLTALLEPFQFDFMINALDGLGNCGDPLRVIVGVSGAERLGVNGRRHEFAAVFPGIVLAYIAGIPLAIGAFIAGLSARLSPAISTITAALSAIPSWNRLLRNVWRRAGAVRFLSSLKSIWIIFCSAICWACPSATFCKRR